MNDQELSERIRFALACLPTDPYAIGHEFRALEIKGTRNDPLSCPITNYLRRTVSRLPNYITTQMGVYVEHQHVSVALTKEIREFMSLFDTNHFKELEEDE